MQKRWVKIALVVLGVIILAAIVAPLLVNADTFRPTVEQRLSGALGRRVSLGQLSFSLFTGSLVARDIAIADDPAFSTAPFLKAQKLNIGVEVGPLIFHRVIRVTSFVIDTPAVQLIQNQAGKWNFSTIGAAAPRSAPAQQPAANPDVAVNELKIKDGSVTVLSIPATRKPFVYSDLTVNLKQFSLGKSFPFDLSAKLPADGTLKLSGTAGPISPKDASDTPFRVTLQIRHLDPVAADIIDPSKGIAMISDIDAQIVSDGETVSSAGKIRAAKLQLARNGSPAPQPVDVDYKISENLDARTGKVVDIAIHTGSVAAHVTGGFRMTPGAVVLDLRLNAPNLPVDQLETLLPVVGIHLPAGSSLHGGTLTANIAVSGIATEATITGPVELANTKLVGFDLGSKIQGLNPFGGTGGGTDIQTLRATVRSTPQSTEISDIYGNLPQIGTATGAGTVSAAGALNFKMVATLNSSNVAGALANTAMIAANNAVGNLIGGFLGQKPGAAQHTNANRGIPLTITGTADKPSIKADIGAMLR